ncbi:hypothetical protein DSL72_000156 [Monilinia vaccinii-corymbosi]|uniref:Uncharacterized protein n=1 Tax=Monilinia vaccinii-corymbosi TaxID=61207 RepID=A0A8A3P9C3_9HELO|nr:hypothetical protein DSL72_000156 [Monilinia vaccinii-corymbosi]
MVEQVETQEDLRQVDPRFLGYQEDKVDDLDYELQNPTHNPMKTPFVSIPSIFERNGWSRYLVAFEKNDHFIDATFESSQFEAKATKSTANTRLRNAAESREELIEHSAIRISIIPSHRRPLLLAGRYCEEEMGCAGTCVDTAHVRV